MSITCITKHLGWLKELRENHVLTFQFLPPYTYVCMYSAPPYNKKYNNDSASSSKEKMLEVWHLGSEINFTSGL